MRFCALKGFKRHTIQQQNTKSITNRKQYHKHHMAAGKTGEAGMVRMTCFTTNNNVRVGLTTY